MTTSPLVKNVPLYPKVINSGIPTISIESPSHSIIETDEVKIKYPSILHETTAPDSQLFGESELLSEGQLLEYYKNEQLDYVDDFTDFFIQVCYIFF